MRKSRLLLCCSTAAITTAVFIFVASCHKSPATEDTGFAADHAATEQTFTDVQSISDQAANISSGSLGYKTTATTIGGCATVTRAPGKITIDFGTTDCTCHDGRKRRGTIIVTYTGAYADSGSVHTVTFSNYYQNDNKVTGTKTVTNMGLNASGQPYFNIHESGSITYKGGGTVSSEWNRVRTWTAGYSTLTYLADDVYEVTGSGKLTRANSEVININITTPLIVALNCHWIEAGAVTFAMSNGKSRILNYGDLANCDDQATVTLSNGNVWNITLP